MAQNCVNKNSLFLFILNNIENIENSFVRLNLSLFGRGQDSHRSNGQIKNLVIIINYISIFVDIHIIVHANEESPAVGIYIIIEVMFHLLY
jgi:hypothetical protein